MASSARHNLSVRQHHIPVRVGPDRTPPGASPVIPEVREGAEQALRTGRTSGVSTGGHAASEKEDWQDRALRLQADMESYRKRQRRIALEQARAEQERWIVDLLDVADNLDRTLRAAQNDTPIRRGVELTRDELQKLLRRYGVQRVEAHGKPFDPVWHEAVDTVSATVLGVRPGIVIRVARPGYRREERLLRPAQVVVAQ